MQDEGSLWELVLVLKEEDLLQERELKTSVIRELGKWPLLFLVSAPDIMVGAMLAGDRVEIG